MRPPRARRKRVLSVIGTRPEAIKMGPVLKLLATREDAVESVVVATGQHRLMLDQVLSSFGIQPQHDLDVMRPNQDPAEVAYRTLRAMQHVLGTPPADLVLVQGDTTTTLAAALAAAYAGIPLGHVEAGLRSFDKANPFPEEINRRVTGALADYHFAPTPAARTNLLREGVPPERVFVTGNTVVDALQMMDTSAAGRGPATLDDPSLFGKRLIVVTAHRRENLGAPLERICRAVKELVARYEDVGVVFPVHLNPNVRRTVHRSLSGVPRVVLTEPFEYLSFLMLLRRAHLVLTDSGGIQEEAPSLGKVVLVLRSTTERPEACEAGRALLVGTDTDGIVHAAARLLDDPSLLDRMARGANPYGDGRAAERIVRALMEILGTADGSRARPRAPGEEVSMMREGS